MNQDLIEDAKRGGFVSEIMRRLGKLESDIRFLLTMLGGGRERLTGNRTYYVRTDGSDSNDGLANTAARAFLTIQRAVDVVALLDIGANTVTIQVGAGTYGIGATQILLKQVVGVGTCILQGDTTTPSNVVITGSANGLAVIESRCITPTWTARGFRLQGTGVNQIGIAALNGTYVAFSSLDFNTGFRTHIYADWSGFVYISGNYAVTAGCVYHIYAAYFGKVNGFGRTITFTAALNFSGSTIQSDFGYLAIMSMTFVNGATITGTRYWVRNNGVINTNGGGAAYVPGNVAGISGTGGQYI